MNLVKHSEELFVELESKLKEVYFAEEDLLKRTEMCILVCEEYLHKLKLLFEENTLKDQEEEIEFFKAMKPKFASRLMYNIHLFNLEYKRPKNQQKIEKKYLMQQVKKINLFLDDNTEFYKYYKTGATYLDHRYFVRGVRDIHLLLDTRIYYFDQEFTTSHGHLVASILAYEMLLKYIEKELRKLARKEQSSEASAKTNLNWTESKTALTELVYALHSTGALNNGKAEISEIALVFEGIFNVELNNYYRSYMEIRMRKHNKTKFLDQLKTKFVARMEEDDER